VVARQSPSTVQQYNSTKNRGGRRGKMQKRTGQAKSIMTMKRVLIVSTPLADMIRIMPQLASL
jgi:hypothetical protein